MANKKISELTAATALTGAELVEVVQGGNSRRSSIAAAQYVARDTYANIVSGYAAATYSGRKAFATDVGPSGSEFFSNGSRWIPVNGRVLLDRLTLPLVKAPTINANASGTANGATALATAVPTRFAKAYFYVPANSIVASHSAGWYYGEMSDTTNITFYNNTYTPAAGVYPTEPTNKVAFSGAVPGGTGVTSSVTAFISAVKGGILGEYGALYSDALVECNSTAGGKAFQINFNASAVCIDNPNSTASAHGIHVIKNMAYNRQRTASRLINNTTALAAYSTSVDTSADATLSYIIQTSSAANDLIALSSLTISAEVLS